MEMALYLELCVLQICGIRPVLGRVEDFSKEVKLLMKGETPFILVTSSVTEQSESNDWFYPLQYVFVATETHAFLKPSLKSLKQILSVVYPGLLQADDFL